MLVEANSQPGMPLDFVDLKHDQKQKYSNGNCHQSGAYTSAWKLQIALMYSSKDGV